MLAVVPISITWKKYSWWKTPYRSLFFVLSINETVREEIIRISREMAEKEDVREIQRHTKEKADMEDLKDLERYINRKMAEMNKNVGRKIESSTIIKRSGRISSRQHNNQPGSTIIMMFLTLP